MDSIERSAKTVEEAVEEALAFLKTTKDKVEIEILEKGAKGFLGFGQKPAKIRMTVKFDPETAVREFLKEVTLMMGLAVTIEIKSTERNMDIEMKGANLGVLIGKRGQTLDALQYLVNLVVNKGNAPYISVNLDTEDYRSKRKLALENLAKNLAKKAKITKKMVILEPMTPYERRIIHAALQNDRYVSTYSQGEEPYRNVVISPNK